MANIQNSSKDYSAASSRLATAGNGVVVGFDDDLLAIKEKLCGETRNLQIIPIVGMGGIGKTTLARNAFHDPLIKESFHIGGWVTVSQSYNLQQILTTFKESLKESFDGKQPEEEEAEKEGHRFFRAKGRRPLLSAKRPKHLLQKSQKVDFQESQQEIVFEETDKYAANFHEECTEPATTAKEHDETNVLESLKESFDGKQPEEEEAEEEGQEYQYLGSFDRFFRAKGRRPLPRAKRPKHLLQKSQKVDFQESQQEIVFEEETHKYAADFHEECTEPATATCEEHDETNVLESHKAFDGKQLEEGHESQELIPKRRLMNRKQASVRNAKAILQKSQTGNLKQSLKDAKGLEEGHESQKVVPEEETREYRAEFFEECCEYATEQSEEVDEIKVLESAARTSKQSLKPFKAKRLEEAQGSEELEFEPKKIPMTMKVIRSKPYRATNTNNKAIK